MAVATCACQNCFRMEPSRLRYDANVRERCLLRNLETLRLVQAPHSAAVGCKAKIKTQGRTRSGLLGFSLRFFQHDVGLSHLGTKTLVQAMLFSRRTLPLSFKQVSRFMSRCIRCTLGCWHAAHILSAGWVPHLNFQGLSTSKTLNASSGQNLQKAHPGEHQHHATNSVDQTVCEARAFVPENLHLDGHASPPPNARRPPTGAAQDVYVRSSKYIRQV